MASRNELKPSNAANATFHVYNRGAAKQPIFRDQVDYREFLDCFRRHLSPERFVDSRRRVYRKLDDAVELLAYCLMPNHFHLILHQHSDYGMSQLMQSSMTGYVRYFNARHDRVGHLFQGRYKASRIITPGYAKRAIAYVHLNHETHGVQYQHTSHRLYVGDLGCDWIGYERGLRVFGGCRAYLDYVDRAAKIGSKDKPLG